MGTRGNRIQLYITMGTVFRPFAMAALCDGGPLRWRTGTAMRTFAVCVALADARLHFQLRNFHKFCELFF